MRFIILQIIAVIVMISNPAGAALIQGVRMTESGVQMDVVYGGGCKDHVFSLKRMVCTRSTPMSCALELIDEGQDDPCRALIPQTIDLPLDSNILSGQVNQLIFMDSEKNITTVEI